MGIYERDKIPYQSMIDAAINNRKEKGKIRGDNWRKQGELWSNFTSEMGKMGGRMLDAYQANKEAPEARLQALEEELRQAEIEEAYNKQVEQRRAVDKYIQEAQARAAAQRDNFISRQAADMDGYKTIPQGYGQPQQGNNLFGLEEFYRRGGIY